MCGKGAGAGPVRTGKYSFLFILNKDMDIIRIIKWLENLGVLTDGFTETVKHETKREQVQFLFLF